MDELKIERKSNLGDTIAIDLMLMVSILLLASRLFIFTPYAVMGESMLPTLEDGDRLIMKKKVKIDRGDIIVLDSPNKEDELYIKRIIAVGGDTVVIKGGKVSVNGKQLGESSRFGDTVAYGEDGVRELSLDVPNREVFVLGDNRENSLDSRVFGTVKESTIKGEFWCRIYPLSRIGFE